MPQNAVYLEPHFSFSNDALAQICQYLTCNSDIERGGSEIERGGALLGPRDSDHVSVLLMDKWAPLQRLHYRPSEALVRQVVTIEETSSLVLQGIIHSHPRGASQPSLDDQHASGAILKSNPHRRHLLFPIVYAPAQEQTSHPLGCHEQDLGPVRLSLLYREQNDQWLKPAIYCPLYRDVANIASQLFDIAIPQGHIRKSGWISLLGRIEAQRPTTTPPLESVTISLPGVDLLLIAPAGYPLFPPLLIATTSPSSPQALGNSPNSQDIPIVWSLDVPAPRRLSRALAAVIDRKSVLRALESPEDTPLHIAFGPNPQIALTRSKRTARQAGWKPVLGGSTEVTYEKVRLGTLSRAVAVQDAQALSNCRVCVFGLGSVGSLVATRLARAGVGALDLVDPDQVAAANLSRSEYCVGDLGRLKVEALRERLFQFAAPLQVTISSRAVQQLSEATLRGRIESADMVIAATDDPEAQRRLAQYSYKAGVPCVSIGLYAKAFAGEVLYSSPGETPCLLCATRSRLDGGRPDALNYGTGRLVGEPALGGDIAWVVEIGVRVALALMLRRCEVKSELTAWTEALLRRGWSFAMAATQAEYSFFPRIFGKTPGQCGHQTVWMHVQGDPQCPVCGKAEWRATCEESGRSGFLGLDASEIAELASTGEYLHPRDEILNPYDLTDPSGEIEGTIQ
jgi:molybdopterin/thiamine biosynthesis adenylyltransferase